MNRLRPSGALRAGGVLAIGLIALAGGARAAGNPDKGKDVALKWCVRCHVVGDHNPYGGIDSTPWFRTFARKPETYPPERIRTFYLRPPHPPQGIKVTDKEMDDLIAFIATLKDR